MFTDFVLHSKIILLYLLCVQSRLMKLLLFVDMQAHDAAQLPTGGFLIRSLLPVVSGSCRGHGLLVNRQLDHETSHARDFPQASF